MSHIFQFTALDWTTAFIGIQTLILLIGVTLALKNLRVISRTHKLGAIEKFTTDLVEFEASRQFIYQEFAFDKSTPLVHAEEVHIKKVINSLNRISMLIDNNILSTEIVFAMCHSMFIRCEYKLSAYISFQEELIGGRYGRRILKLAKRAKQYHDSNRHHHVSCIKLYDGETNREIYKTHFQTGFITRRAQKIEWWLRRRYSWY